MKEEPMYHAEIKALLEFAKKQLSCVLIKKKNEGYSQSFLAKMLGIDQPRISMLMFNKKKATLSLGSLISMMEQLGYYAVIDMREREMEKRLKIFDRRSFETLPTSELPKG